MPYKIISDAIPRIEQDVNNILSQMVEFSMGIETDGKNVNVYIKYDDKNGHWNYVLVWKSLLVLWLCEYL